MQIVAIIALPVLGLLNLLRIRLTDREKWEQLSDRGASLPGMSRADVLFYGLLGAAAFGVLGNTIFRTTEVSEQTERNTKRMGEVVEQMRESSDQSLTVLAAMRDEADAARRETAAAQRLALWVGVTTAILGAALGGVAGAFAANAIR